MSSTQTFTDKKKLTQPVYYNLGTKDVGDFTETRYLVKQRARPYGKELFWTITLLIGGILNTLIGLIAFPLLFLGVPVLIYNGIKLRGTNVISYVTHQRHKVTGALNVIKE